jgi:glycosyltransferase involved in cell wall biosynthesis
MKTDVLFLSRNRLEFTRESFAALVANTDWSLVDTLWVYDDGSTDGTRDWLRSQRMPVPCANIIDSMLGAPAAIMNDYLKRSAASLFAKVDNDVIMPPGWLNRSMDVMVKCANLDLLGVEPPESRTPHFAGGIRSMCPELTALPGAYYARCDSIGGIGLMRRSAFLKYPDMVPHSTHGGFTDWQLKHGDVIKGWIVPSLKVFLLDRLPGEPWTSLSKRYIAKGWQRAWSGYDPANPFWNWYTPSHLNLNAAVSTAI